MEKPESNIIDALVAEVMATKAFMLAIATRLARNERDSDAWAVSLISDLHEALDAAERQVGITTQIDDPFGWHEAARHRLDLLGVQLRAAVSR